MGFWAVKLLHVVLGNKKIFADPFLDKANGQWVSFLAGRFELSVLSLIHHFDTVPNSKKLQTTIEMILTLSQTSPGFYVSAVQAF